jgi:phage shock protein PspC (stress-responsive transcriptional regulator)
MNSNKRLTRSSRDRKIAGVCGGLAEFSGIDATIIRILFVILALAGATVCSSTWPSGSSCRKGTERPTAPAHPHDRQAK